MDKTFLSLSLVITGLHGTPAWVQEAHAAPATADARTEAPDLGDEEEGADGGAHGFIAFGPGLVPAFDGARKYRPVPLAIADVAWRGLGLEVRGLGARLDLLGGSRIQFGPIVNYRGGRDSREDGSGRVRLLDDVDPSLEVGAYVGYRVGGDRRGRGELALDLSLAGGVNGDHDGGLVGSAQASYAAYRGERLFVNVDARTTFADGEHMRASFGVTRAEAARSGLDTHRPDAGLRDAGAGITAGYRLDERWGVIARAGASYYLGDAGDSPIVDEGSRVQAVGGLALSLRF